MQAGKIALIVVLALALAGGGYALYGKFKGSGTAALTPQGREVEVKRGALEVKVNASGSLAATRKVNLTFSSSGTIKERLVDMGDTVKKGQVLARLDTLDLERAALDAESGVKSAEKALKDNLELYDLSAVAQVEAAMAAAQAQVKAAEKAFQDVQTPYNLSPYTPADIAQAEASVAAAQAQVKAGEKALQDVQTPYNLSPYTPADIAQAEASVAAAQAQVKASEKAFQDMQPPYNLSPYSPGDVAQAEATVAAAQAAVKNAENAFNKAQTLLTKEDIAHYQAAVDNAQKALAIAQQDLVTAKSNRDRSVADTQEALRQEQEKYKPIIKMPLTGDIIYLDPRIILGVDSITNNLETAYQSLLNARDNARIAQEQGDKNVSSAESAVAKAQDALKKAQEDLDRKIGDVSVDLAVRQHQLEDAKASLIKAQEELNKRKSGPEPLEIANRQFSLENAKASLIKAQEDLKKRKSGPEPLEIANRQFSLENAKASLIKAQEDLKKRKSGPEPLEIASRQASLENAKASLIKAQEELKKKKAGPDPVDLALRKAQLAAAQAALDKAKDNLAKATIVAPSDGVVASVSGEVGDTVGANAVVMVVIDPRQLRLEAVLDETSVVQVKTGQEVQVSLDALPNVSIKGKVTSISPVSVLQSGVVNYQVFISLETETGTAPRPGTGAARSGGPMSGSSGMGAPGASGPGRAGQPSPNDARNDPSGQLPPFRSGMTAVAEIVTARQENVLLVPRQAVTGSGQNRTVKIMVNGQVEERTVRLGRSDEQFVEVMEGLSEGDKVLIAAPTTRSINPVAPSKSGAFGGGMGGLPIR